MIYWIFVCMIFNIWLSGYAYGNGDGVRISLTWAGIGLPCLLCFFLIHFFQWCQKSIRTYFQINFFIRYYFHRQEMGLFHRSSMRKSKKSRYYKKSYFFRLAVRLIYLEYQKQHQSK